MRQDQAGGLETLMGEFEEDTATLHLRLSEWINAWTTSIAHRLGDAEISAILRWQLDFAAQPTTLSVSRLSVPSTLFNASCI
jgi:hypothetical protein